MWVLMMRYMALRRGSCCAQGEAEAKGSCIGGRWTFDGTFVGKKLEKIFALCT